jgi:hypothetical protein
MKYSELSVDGKTYTDQKEISKKLKSEGFTWLIDCEIENAKLEIRKNTLIWHSGDFLFGVWKWGIFKSGSFHGKWQGGIFEGGNIVDGTAWNGGINLVP